MNRVSSLRSVCPLLQVRDIRASIHFYVDVLGFKVGWEDPDGFVILERDDCRIFLGQKQTNVDLRNSTARAKPDGFASYDLHIHCEKGTLDRLWREFRDLGATMPPEFNGGPVDRFYGIRDFSIIDPDGYTIVFGADCEP